MLQGRLTSLLASAGSTLGQMTGERDTHADTVDLAAEESSREFALRVQEHERVLVRQIQGALRRIGHGDYGECVACGEDIAERRLMARPMAIRCIDCKTELEIRSGL
jgi:DnaK suppressor protein